MTDVEAPAVAHRVVMKDRGKASMQRRALRVLPAILVLGLCSLVAYDVATEGELVSRPSQFLHERWAPAKSSVLTMSDLRFPSRNASAFHVEVLTNFTVLDKTESHEEGCVAGVANPHEVTYPSGHRFYSLLRDISPLPPPVFRGKHLLLCNETMRHTAKYAYCLPMTGRKDQPFCSAPDRLDLLAHQSGDSLCYASVLHMLMTDVYNELEDAGAQPLLVFGSLLGAIRDSSVISFTEDADISYMKRDKEFMLKVQERLWNKGYHMFMDGIWRVCVAPTHPLASNMYNPKAALSHGFSQPYTDLYQMEQQKHEWNLQETKNHRKLLDKKVRPFAQVHINGIAFDTVSDPIDFLTQEYGKNFMTPKPRKAG